MPEITHQSLQLPGYWRLASFGKLARVPQRGIPARIRAYLIQLGDRPPFDFEREDRLWRSMQLPIGEIARLHHNAVIHNGKILKRAPVVLTNARPETLNVDFTRSNQIVFERYDRDNSGGLIIPDPTGRLRNDPEGTALFVAVGHGRDPYAVIFPCVEILRFFYATSSMIVNALFSGHFLDPWNYLWNTKESWIHENGNAFLQLRQYTFDADARFLARFAFNDYALKRAQEVFKYAAGHRPDQYGERVVRAIPPFEGPTRLNVTALLIVSGGHERMLITQIHTCNWSAPFSHLIHDRDNDGRYNSRDRDGKNPADTRSGRAPIQPDPPPEEITLSTNSSSDNAGRWAITEDEIKDRFPELSKISVEKAPQNDTKTAGTIRVKLRKTIQGNTGSVEGPRTSSDLIAHVLIQSLNETKLPEPDGSLDTEPGPESSAYRTTLALLRIMQKEAMATIEIKCVTEQFALVDGARMCVFPTEVCGIARAWLYMDREKKIRRLALVASIEKNNKYRYLIDIQHKIEHECSMVLCWKDDESELPLPFLQKALNACASAKGTSLWAMDIAGLSWNRSRHTATSADEETAKHLLRKLLRLKAIKPLGSK